MIDGTADRPFVLRTLVPSTIRLIRDALPEPTKAGIASFLGSRAWYSEYLHSSRAVEFAIALPLVFLLILGYSINLRRLARRFYPGAAHEATVTALLGTMLLVICFAYGHYIYDPGTLFFFSLGLLFVVENSLVPLLILFPFLALQKETSILLIPVFVLWHSRDVRTYRVVLPTIAMIVLWGGIRLMVAHAYELNAGSLLEFHLLDHNLRLLAFPAPLVFFLVTVLLVSRDWKSKHLFLRRGLLVTLVPLFLLSVFFGFMDELRQFYEPAPSVALLIAPTVVKYSGTLTS